MTTSLSVIISLFTFVFLFAWIFVEIKRFNKKTEIKKFRIEHDTKSEIFTSPKTN